MRFVLYRTTEFSELIGNEKWLMKFVVCDKIFRTNSLIFTFFVIVIDAAKAVIMSDEYGLIRICCNGIYMFDVWHELENWKTEFEIILEIN